MTGWRGAALILALLLGACSKGSGSDGHPVDANPKRFAALLISQTAFQRELDALKAADAAVTTALQSQGAATVPAIDSARKTWDTAENQLIEFTPEEETYITLLPNAEQLIHAAAKAWAVALEEMRLRAIEGSVTDAKLKQDLDSATAAYSTAYNAMIDAGKQSLHALCEVELQGEKVTGHAADSVCHQVPVP